MGSWHVSSIQVSQYKKLRFGENGDAKDTPSLPQPYAPAGLSPVDIDPLKKSLKARTDLKNNVRKKELQGVEGFFRFLGSMLLIGSAYMGFSTIRQGQGELQQYYKSVPTGERAILEDRMKDRKETVTDPLKALAKTSGQFADKLYYQTNYRNKVDFIQSFMNYQDQIRTVLTGFVSDLKAEKNPADQALIEKLEKIIKNDLSEDWESQDRIMKSDLMNFYGRLVKTIEANRGAGLIESIHKLVTEAPEFSGLSAVDKEGLAGGIIAIAFQGNQLSPAEGGFYRSRALTHMAQDGTSERKLYQLLKFYQGDFLQLPHTFGSAEFREDVRDLKYSYGYGDNPDKFLTTLVNNSENFKALTPEEKARFLAQGKESVSAVFYRFHQYPGYEFFDNNHFIIMMGVLQLLASVGALAGWNGYRILEAREKAKGKDRLLHVSAYDMDKGTVEILVKKIRTLCEEIAKPRLSAFKQGPSEITAYFERLYGPEPLEAFKQDPAKLTDLMYNQYLFQMYETLLPTQQNNKITDLELHQKVLEKVEQAVREKDYLPEGFMMAPMADEGVTPVSERFTEDKLKAGIVEVERLRTRTYTVLINQLLAEFPLKEVVDAHQEKLANLESQAAAATEDVALQQQVVLERRVHQTEETLYRNAQQKSEEIRATLKQLDAQKMSLQLLLLELQEQARLKVADEDGGRIEGLKLATSESPLLSEIRLRLEANSLLKALSGQTGNASGGNLPPEPS